MKRSQFKKAFQQQRQEDIKAMGNKLLNNSRPAIAKLKSFGNTLWDNRYDIALGAVALAMGDMMSTVDDIEQLSGVTLSELADDGVIDLMPGTNSRA